MTILDTVPEAFAIVSQYHCNHVKNKIQRCTPTGVCQLPTARTYDPIINFFCVFISLTLWPYYCHMGTQL